MTPRTIPAQAAGAISAARFVVYDQTTKKVSLATSALEDGLLGVSDGPALADGDQIDVHHVGRANVLAGADLPPFVPVTTDSQGRAVQAKPGDVVLGYHWQDEWDSDGPDTVPSGAEASIMMLPSRFRMAQGDVQTRVGWWDFATHGSPGGAGGKALVDRAGNQLTIPEGAIILDTSYFVTTAPLPNDATTIKLTRGADAPVLLTAVAINNVAAPFSAGGHKGDQVLNTGSTWDQASGATGGLSIQASGALTAGSIQVVVTYALPIS